MKKALLAAFSSILILLFLLIFFTLYGWLIRYVEITNALNSSMEHAIAQLQFDEGVPASEDVWINAFAESVAMQINSHSDLEIHIYEADIDKGLLSAEAVLTFLNPIGNETSVTSGKRTILLEEYVITQNMNLSLNN